MPKAYSDSERKVIINDLKYAAKDCLKQFGYRKTSVDELVRRANIPKGTFYLFYSSKDALIYEIFMETHDQLQNEFLDAIVSCKQPLTSDDFAATLITVIKNIDNSFLLPFMTSGDTERLMRKLNSEQLKEHEEHDMAAMMTLMQVIPHLTPKNIEAYMGAFRGVLLLCLHKKEVGQNCFNDTVYLLILSLSRQLFKEDTLDNCSEPIL